MEKSAGEDDAWVAWGTNTGTRGGSVRESASRRVVAGVLRLPCGPAFMVQSTYYLSGTMLLTGR